MRSLLRLATAGLVAGGALLFAWHRLPALLLRRRIRRHLDLVHALREHAVAARALSARLGPAHPDRQRALRKLQSKVLAQLTRGRTLVDALLLELHGKRATAGGPRNEKALCALISCEARSRAEIASETALAVDLLGPAALSAPPPGRRELLRAEEQALTDLAGGRANPNAPAVPRWRLHQLRRALASLRGLESDLNFQAVLLSHQLQMEETTGYSRGNFAYGSTPLPSWLALFACEPVQAVLRAQPAAKYVVLGSSIGWLCFYGACVYGLPTRGIELLPNLVTAAERVGRTAGIEGVQFKCADMLKTDLRLSQLVVLASQCWDAPLLSALRLKLLEELPDGALVLDYTPLLGERPPETPEQSAHGDPPTRTRGFVLACTVDAPVSWDGAHTFWVWRVGRA